MKTRLALIATLFLTTTLACWAEPITVSGTIADGDGVPPAAAFCLLLSPEDYGLVAGPAPADAAGHYSLQAQGGHDYILLVIPLSGQTEQGYNLHGQAIQLARLEVGNGDVVRDFTLVPGHDFILEGYRPDGSLVSQDGLVGLHFAADMAGNATDDVFFGIDKGEGTLSVPSVCVPLGQTRRFFVQWTVPDFGNVVLAIDNGGIGYAADEPGGTVLNLNYELTRTQIERLRTNLRDYRAAGYDVPPAIPADLVQAEALLAQAAAQAGAEQAALADRATSTALWALEALELARARQDIARHRRGSLAVTVLDASGEPLPGATVAYTQTSRDFLFGIFDTLGNAGIEGYERMQQAGINYLTAGFYWIETEPEQDHILWEKIDHEIGVLDLADMGFGLKAHALLALWDFATPDYFRSMSFDEFDGEVHQHISALVGRYRDQIGIWNVINEAHGRNAALGFSRAQITTLTQTGIRAIRENDPGARIIVNNSFDWYGESRLMTYLLTGEPDDFTLSVPAYLDQLAADDVEYDIVGQQLYNGGYVRILADWGLGDPMGVPTWDLVHHSAVLDRLGEYGKPVHVTEQSVPSAWDQDWAQCGAGWWHRPWDESTQAEFVRDFYTIAFSKEHVEAVTWWNINDNYCFIVNGGLLDERNQPKPAYHALRDLVTGWTTAGQGQTDAAGQLVIQGYGGEYDLVVTHNGQTWRGTAHVWEQQRGALEVWVGRDSAVWLPMVSRGRIMGCETRHWR